MPKLPRLTAEEAERLLLKAGFQYIRGKGGHRIYKRENERFVLPYHKGKMLHPKIVKALMEALESS